MSRKKVAALHWNHMTDTRAEILEAYFSLYQTREPTTIGSGEILHWFRERQRTAPSEALIRTLLAEIQAPRRGGGRPAHDTAPVETLPPFLPAVRRDPLSCDNYSCRSATTTPAGRGGHDLAHEFWGKSPRCSPTRRSES